LVTVLISGCEKSSTNPPLNIPNYTAEDRSFFPLSFGNTWKYAIVEAGDTVSYYDYIVGEVTTGNDLRAVLRYQSTAHTVEEYARWIDDEFRVSSQYPYDIELVLLKIPLTVGRDWEVYNYTNENLVWESYAEVVDDSVAISTVAGDFVAVKIRELFTHHQTEAPVYQDSIFHYYVKGIGRVRSVEPNEVHELRFYNVQPEE